MLFYSMYKNDGAAIGFVVNFLLPGLGIGNYIIGDTSGGTITLVGSLASWVVYAVGIGMIYTSGSVGAAIGYIGLGGVVFFGVRGWVSPFTYTSYYNDQLKKSLMMSPVASLKSDSVFHLDLISISF